MMRTVPRTMRALSDRSVLFCSAWLTEGAKGWWAMRDSNPRPPRCKRDALPAELIARNRSLRPFASGFVPSSEADEHWAARARPARPQLSSSRNRLPALNLACFEAAIWIFSPVRGLRPSDAARLATEKVPNPTNRTSVPPFNASVIESNTASTALLAADFDRSALPATASTSSFLFTCCPLSEMQDGWRKLRGEFIAAT